MAIKPCTQYTSDEEPDVSALDKRLDTKKASVYLSEVGVPTTAGTLITYRSLKIGPAYFKVKRRVFYTKRTLLEYAKGKKILTTDSLA